MQPPPPKTKTKKLFNITTSALTPNKLISRPFFFKPLPDLPAAVSNFFIDKIVNIRCKHDSQSVCPISLSIWRCPLCIFQPVSESVVRSFILKSARKPANLIWFLPLFLWNISILSFLLSLFSSASLSAGVFPQVFWTENSWPERTKELPPRLWSIACLQDHGIMGSFSAPCTSLYKQPLQSLSLCLSTRTQHRNCTSECS